MKIPVLDAPNLKRIKSGKVREMYQVSEDKLVIVTTDRISAFDYVLPTEISGKGDLLNQMSKMWFEHLKDFLIANDCHSHMLTCDIGDIGGVFANYPDVFVNRLMLVMKLDMIPIECVVRGYLAGSAWAEYKTTGKVCGIKFPNGLKEWQQLLEPVFTPARKNDTGHDENISFDQMVLILQEHLQDKVYGDYVANYLRDLSIAIYNEAARYAWWRGIIIADTKFEFGMKNDQIWLGDEVLTPDSSRFCGIEDYCIGTAPPSFDKQFVRDYLTKIGWNKKSPAPSLPEDVVRHTYKRYTEVFGRLFGK